MTVAELRKKLERLPDEAVIEAGVTSEGQHGFDVVWDETPTWPDEPVVLYIEADPDSR